MSRPAGFEPKTILIVCGEPSTMSGSTASEEHGSYTRTLAQLASERLGQHFLMLNSDVSTAFDPAQELEKVKEADTIIFQYPIYWFMVPASLKQWLDTVYPYTAEFTGPCEATQGGQMQCKRFMLSTTWSAPFGSDQDESQFFDEGTIEQVLAPMRALHKLCGMAELPSFACHNVNGTEHLDADKARYLEHLETLFGLESQLAPA